MTLSKTWNLRKSLKAGLTTHQFIFNCNGFDAIEGVEVSSVLKSKRWSTELTRRDNMYLEKLGCGTYM